MPWICLSLVIVALLVSLPLCAGLIGVSRRMGLVDAGGREAHKRHARAVPNTGGIAIFLAIVLPLLAAILAIWLIPGETLAAWLPSLKPHLPGLRAMTVPALVLLAGITVLHITGLIDDRRPLGPGVKLLVQLVVAAGLVAFGQMHVLSLLEQFGLWGAVASVILSVAWIVVIVNAMNFLDNMDGLAAGVGAIIAALYLAATLIGGQWFVAGLAAVLLGALLGFLIFNIHPAKLFMGDAGSLVLGLVLAVIAIRTTYFNTNVAAGALPGVPGPLPGAGATSGGSGGWYGILMPLMILAVPLYDCISVTMIRLLRGQSPFRGDHSHFSHRLVRRGLSQPKAVAVIWLCTLATGLGGVMLNTLQGWQALLAAGQTLAVLAVLALLEMGGAKELATDERRINTDDEEVKALKKE